jgi:hypothetical protein
MAGKFINKQYVNTVDSLTKGTVNKVKNANYLFNDKPPVLLKAWYNLNKRGTTFDEGTQAEYVALGKNSPLRFNKISGAVIYSSGIKIAFDVQYDEDGLGVSQMPNIGGIVLPNTWIPYVGDYFSIDHAGKEWLYKVSSVSFDTIDNGNNIYSFEAAIDNYGIELIEKQVVERYKMIVNNIGSDFNAVIKEENYDLIDRLDSVLTTLKDYYIALFYCDRVQTFVYEGKYGFLYDPYMIEFILRNEILKGSTEYIFVHHEVQIPRTFAIDYNNSLYRAIENKSIENFNNKAVGAEAIEDKYSLFATVLEQYYKIDYNKGNIFGSFQPLDSALINNVKENVELDVSESKAIYNIIVRYFNNKSLDSSTIDILEKINFEATPILFYAIPMIIYSIEYSIKNLLK